MAIVKSIATEKDITTINVDAIETTYISLTSVDVDLIIFSISTDATEDVGMVEDLHLTHTTDVVLNKNCLKNSSKTAIYSLDEVQVGIFIRFILLGNIEDKGVYTSLKNLYFAVEQLYMYIS